jgi:3-deoxy-D-manno-octulosonic-acid transferase
MIWLYNILMAVLLVFGLPVVLPYLALSAKRRPILLRRLGIVRPRPIPHRGAESKKPIWIHALSVGEVLASVPLITALRLDDDDRSIVFSVSTRTGHDIAREKLGALVDAVFFFPFDLPFAVKRVAACIRPAMVIMIETDIWPNFLFDMKRRGVPVTLANAKLSRRSFSGYRRIAPFFREVFSCFTALCCQSVADADRFRRLGLPEDLLSVTGNIKFDQTEMPLPVSEVADLRNLLGIGRRQWVWIAGSTHEGEETVIQQAFGRIKKENPHLMLVVAPRNPERAGSVSRIFSAAGFDTVALSALGGRASQKQADVIVIDTLGLLKNLYALADVALVGGSLIRIRGIGGHNPLEPAAFAKPILFGPHMHNFREIAAMLTAAGGAIQVINAHTLGVTVNDLLADRDRAQHMGQNARRVFDTNKGAVARTMAVITDQLASRNQPPKGDATDLPNETRGSSPIDFYLF